MKLHNPSFALADYRLILSLNYPSTLATEFDLLLANKLRLNKRNKRLQEGT
jgi:hypothetical protein